MNNMLLILDGFGINDNQACVNAIKMAEKPNLDRLFAQYPNTIINASGLSVGLPEGQMGNSEVGHLNIGSGRIVYQDLTRITKSIEDGDFFENPVLLAAVNHAKKHNSTLHLMGLLSDGGVHSHISHLFALIELAKMKGLKKVYVHAFLDGRDVPPDNAEEYITELENFMNQEGLGKIVSISGRYYSMDRDRRYERTQMAYDAITCGKAPKISTASEAMKRSYAEGITDEFVKPVLIENNPDVDALVKNNDSIIFFNFRPDRARQLTRAIVDPNFNGFDRSCHPEGIYFVCMTEYDSEMPNVHVAYGPDFLTNTFGEYISKLGYTQLRIAETEKYAHVTFFFNGGVEAPNPNEDRVLIPSPKVPTYDLQPEMSAQGVTDKVIELILAKKYDFIILNFANPDMVGHTGNIPAVVRAIEFLDGCVAKIVTALQETGGQLILTADHGNADCMKNPDGTVVTAHSSNPVPFLVIAHDNVKLKEGGILADVIPTLLDLAGIAKPREMTGHSLLIRS